MTAGLVRIAGPFQDGDIVPEIRCRMGDPGSQQNYPILAESQAEGVTDYLHYRLRGMAQAQEVFALPPDATIKVTMELAAS